MRSEFAYDRARTTSTLRTARARRVRPSRRGSRGSRRGSLVSAGVTGPSDGCPADLGVDARKPARVRAIRPGPAGDVRAGRLSRAIRPESSSGDSLRSVGAEPREGGGTGVACRVVQVFFDTQQLVVFGHPLSTGRCARLDLTAAQGDGKVGDRGVLGLTRAMA